jgi:hypothetical protein
MGRKIGREVSPQALREALVPYPGWLSALYGDWVRDQERRGQLFTSAEAAVRHARDAVNRANSL